MTIVSAKILPVIVSIIIIICIAILREYSRTFAAIAATMPLNIPLGLWLIYSGADDKAQSAEEFTSAVLINIIPTIIFYDCGMVYGAGRLETCTSHYGRLWRVGNFAVDIAEYQPAFHVAELRH